MEQHTRPHSTVLKNRILAQISELKLVKKDSLFSRPPPREKSKASLQLTSLKSDVSLFSQLYIACQSRDGDLDDFFLTRTNHFLPHYLTLAN